MSKYIKSIQTLRPYSNEIIDISIEGSNLIITGGNGSGKTSLVTEIYKKLNHLIFDRKADQLDQIQRQISHWTGEKDKYPQHSHQYESAIRHLEYAHKEHDLITGFPHLGFNERLEFAGQVAEGIGVIEFFEAHRQSAIAEARTASTLEYDRAELSNTESANKIGTKLESHLVNLHTRRLFAKMENEVGDRFEKISEWFEMFRENLRFLLEDNSADIKFDADKFKFYIHQAGKERYTFQNLSSGYSSIFSIVSRLMMRAEYVRSAPSELTGVVIIDEVDAHLHVSLQRKILPFLTRNFPGIQFIVTTHSPFVISSVNDAVIYDLTKDEQVKDLSSYSYEAIIGAIFGIGSSSELLEDRLSELSGIINSKNTDFLRLRELVDQLAPDVSHMDEESKYFVQRGLYALRSHEKKD